MPAWPRLGEVDVLGFTSEFGVVATRCVGTCCPVHCQPARAERHRLPARAAHVRLRPKEIPTPREPNGNLMRPRKAGGHMTDNYSFRLSASDPSLVSGVSGIYGPPSAVQLPR